MLEITVSDVNDNTFKMRSKLQMCFLGSFCKILKMHHAFACSVFAIIYTCISVMLL